MGFFKANKMEEGYAQLKIGMDKETVIRLLGEPTGTRVRNGVNTITWKNAEFQGWMRGGYMNRIIYVDFENDKVIGWDAENMDRSKW